MVPVVMVLLGLVLGGFGPGRRAANRHLILAFVVVLIVQSVLVFGPGRGSSTPAYWIVQAVSLLVGLLLLNGIRAIRSRRNDAYAA